MGDAFNGARFDTGGLWVTESVNLPSERNQVLAVAGVVQNAGMRASVMRAAVTSGFGGPERLEVLDDVAVPEPAAGEVLVEVGACCCTNTDIWLREGSYGREDDSQAQAGWLREVEPPRFPLIQGADIVGRIVETGEGVEQGWLGRRVLVDTTLHDAASTEPYGIAGIFGSERDGGFAEYATAPVTSLGVVEVDDLSDVEVAALGSASFVTAIRMLKRARLVEGELVLIAGASGSDPPQCSSASYEERKSSRSPTPAKPTRFAISVQMPSSPAETSISRTRSEPPVPAATSTS